jgi:hypothetical protein
MRNLKAYLAIVAVGVMEPTHESRTASDVRMSASPLSQIAIWTVEDPPITSVGGDAQPGAIFSRIVSVARLRGGRILVWEPRPPSVRLFDAKGQFVRVFAREGSGPGEVRDAQWIGTAGDTVLLFDKTQRRLTRLTAAGQRVATESFRAADDIGSYSIIGRWSDGSFVLRGGDAMFAGNSADGVRRDSAWIAVTDPLGSRIRRLARIAGSATYQKRLPGDGAYVSPQPFGPSGLVAVGRRLVWIGDNSTPTIIGYDSTGAPVRRLTVPFGSRPIDGRAVAARRDRELAAARSPAVRALVNAKYVLAPSVAPYFSGLEVAPDGSLWITNSVQFDSEQPEVAVLSPEGSLLARLRLPPRFRIVQVDPDVVTGVYRDEDDVEFVRVYRIRR